MYWYYIRHGDFPCRSRCSQVAVLSFNLPESVKIGHPGRPKFDIHEETLIEVRSLGFNWNEIGRMLLVSHWTIQCRVAEFGQEHLSKFDKISDDDDGQQLSCFLKKDRAVVAERLLHVTSAQCVFRNHFTFWPELKSLSSLFAISSGLNSKSVSLTYWRL